MGTGSSSSSSNVIPQELSQLYSQSAQRLLGLQRDMPLNGAPAYAGNGISYNYSNPNPTDANKSIFGYDGHAGGPGSDYQTMESVYGAQQPGMGGTPTIYNMINPSTAGGISNGNPADASRRYQGGQAAGMGR